MIEDKLSFLQSTLESLRSQDFKNWKDKLRQEKDCQYLEQQIEALKLYQQLSLGDWVSDLHQVGEIKELFFSSGGMPLAWVQWSGEDLPSPVQVNKLKLLEDDWNYGYKVGDLCFDRHVHHVIIIRFAWCKNTRSVQPIVEEKEVQRFAYFNNLTPACEILFDFESWENISPKKELDRTTSKKGRQTQSKNTIPASGSLIPFINKKKDKNGQIIEYPKVIGQRVPINLAFDYPEQFFWQFCYSAIEPNGVWKTLKSSCPREKIQAVRAAISANKPIEEIVDFLRGSKGTGDLPSTVFQG
jgi:hypothetical protein